MPRERGRGGAPCGVSAAFWGAALAVGLLTQAGCEDRGLGQDATGRECWDLWECNPGRLCGEMIDCVDFRCRTEDASVLVECPFDDCVRDSDCLVAEPFDCCNGCPQVARRADLAEDPELHCFYEQGSTPPVPPVDCLIDCYACPLCFPQPLGARCDLGACVAVAEGCPSTSPETPTVLTVAQLVASPQTYEGASVQITGTLLPGLPACTDDCPHPRCCQAGMTLDGVIALTGNPCSLQLGFWFDDYCEDRFSSEGLLAGAAYEVWGKAHASSSPNVPVTLELSGLRLRDPSSEGIAGAFDVTVTQIVSDAADPTCTPPTLLVGEPGRVYLAEAGGFLGAMAPMFDCHFVFHGSALANGIFTSRVPISCEVCCCDFELEGEVTGNRIYGLYTSFDGTCRHTYFFEGVRDPLPHSAAP